MTRMEKVARARELRKKGLVLREIAGEMGFAISTVYGWLADPDLSRQRARQARYSQRSRERRVRGDEVREEPGPTSPDYLSEAP